MNYMAPKAFKLVPVASLTISIISFTLNASRMDNLLEFRMALAQTQYRLIYHIHSQKYAPKFSYFIEHISIALADNGDISSSTQRQPMH